MTGDADRLQAQQKARRRAFLVAWGMITAFAVVQTTVNAVSVAHDFHVSPLEGFVLEYSSGVIVVALIPAIAAVLRVAPPEPGRWMRFGLVHLAGSLGFCALHVGGFLVIRKAIYALAGGHYGSADLLYEYRKDVVAYVVFVVVLWTCDWIARLRLGAAPAPARPRLYAMREGARTVRAPVEDIVAVASARNYVEFHLADGGRPLVRDTLAKVEADLAAAGFLRTHRSWLVNPAHVRTVVPATAGDFRLELTTGLNIPLSRRFPQALDLLRRPA